MSSLNISNNDLLALAENLNFGTPTPEQLSGLGAAVTDLLTAFSVVDSMEEDLPNRPGTANREFFVPGQENNPYNAWSARCSIRERDDGKLAGKKIAVKDNIMVAGVPMLNGSKELQGYIPEMDATVVRRVLEAGGEIVGKTHCEYFCLSGGSHTNAYVQVGNPRKEGFSPGGSSSGSAAVVAAGEVTMALGADQGGSIRMPASFSGIVGMKPTYGLVPYTGVAPIEPLIDHVGPMTATVMENALLLEVIAGVDDYDPRQQGVSVTSYTDQIKLGAKGLRVGILTEGFDHPSSEAEVDRMVRSAAESLKSLGADVEEVSISAHRTAPAVWAAVAINGLARMLTQGNGFGTGRLDVYPTDFIRHLNNSRLHERDLPWNIKAMLLAATVATGKHGVGLYGKGVNLARKMRLEYDKTLSQFDALLMPTTPMRATPNLTATNDVKEYWQRAVEVFPNTCPFDITHHPALSLPCGEHQGLPVGLMLVGKHFNEGALYRLAYALEGLMNSNGIRKHD